MRMHTVRSHRRQRGVPRRATVALTLTIVAIAAAGISTATAGSGPVWSPIWTDEFGAFPSSSDWGIYDSAGNAGKGVRSPSAFSAANSILTITGTSDGTTGGMSRHSQQRYGKWEARVKTAGCSCYHPVLILWGTPGSWPQAGEIDYLETSRRVRNTMFVHYGADNSQVSRTIAVDMTQWHTYAVEWTPNYLAAYIDGKQFFYSTDKTIQPPGRVQATIQLDWFPGEVSTEQRTGATMNVDWIKQFQYVAG
jgi:beta-glucanase (GH16 family)